MGENSPTTPISFSQIQTTLYVDKNAIKTSNNTTYVKIELTYDAGNNNAFLKYADVNYYPHSVNVFKIDGNTIRIIIETRNDRSSNTELMYLCANLQKNTDRNSISSFASALKNDRRTLVQLKMTDIFGGEDKLDANAALTQEDPNSQRYTCMLKTPVNVDNETWTWLSSNLSVFTNIKSVLAGINFDTTSAANALLTKSSLDTVMDCKPITGEDQADMGNENVNGTVSREQLFGNTVLLLAVMGIIMSTYVMFFEDILSIGLLKFMDTDDAGLKDNNKKSMNIATLFWYYTIIPYSIVMIAYSMSKHTVSHMMGGIILLMLLALSNYLYKYRISDSLRLTIDESPEFLVALRTFLTSPNILLRYGRICLMVFSLIMFGVGAGLGFRDDATTDTAFNLYVTTSLFSNAAAFYASLESPLFFVLFGCALFVLSVSSVAV